jgi:transcriptional regulator GlxA family with amidase domain
MRERFYSDHRIGLSKNTALEIVTRNRARFSRELRRLAFPIWSYLSCYPAHFMASPLLDDTRRELAQQYLGQRDVSLADTAYLLGFSDQSSFFRAARRWFGNSPGHFRLRLIRERPGRS